MRRSRAHAAAIAVVLLVIGQLAGLAHEADTRHVTCGEHGEELEAATLAGQLHACDQDHLIGVDAEGGGHEDCAISRALHQSTQTPRVVLAPQLVAFVTVTAEPIVAASVRATALYLIAPKTSPPALRSLFA